MNTELIHEIAQKSSDTIYSANIPDFVYGITSIIELLEPFIPKFIKIEDELPPYNTDIETINQFGARFRGKRISKDDPYVNYRTKDGFQTIGHIYDFDDVVAWCHPIPTTHPYEQLLSQLKNKQDESK
jgi:hypothetical protein